MPFAQGHALLIGVGSHAYIPTANVPVTVADAQAVAELLRADAYCGYPPKQVKLLHDAGATKDGILAQLDLLAAKVKEEDTVFFFYCGHGEYGDDGSYYLVSHDAKADLAKRKIVAGTGVRDIELMTRLKALKAKRVLIVINACHSGELSPSLSLSLLPTGNALGQTAPPAALKEGLLGSGSGRIIITACGEEDEKSWIGSGSNTIFAEALLDGLRCNGLASPKGYISVFDLYTHLYEVVKDKVAQLTGQNQNPELTVIKGIGPFAVALCKGSSALDVFDEPAALPTKGNIKAVDEAMVQNRFNSIINNKGIVLIDTTVHGGVVLGDKVGGNKIDRQINQGAGSTYIEGNQINQPGAVNLNLRDVRADKIEITVQVAREINSASAQLAQAPPERRAKIVAFLRKMADTLDEVSAKLKQGEVPSRKCGEMNSYAQMLPAQLGDFMGAAKAEALGRALFEAYDVEQFLIYYANVPDKAAKFGRLEQAAGYLAGAANIIELGA